MSDFLGQLPAGVPLYPFRNSQHDIGAASSVVWTNESGLTIVITGASVEAAGIAEIGGASISLPDGTAFFAANFDTDAVVQYAYAPGLAIPVAPDEEVSSNNYFPLSSIDVCYWGYGIPVPPVIS